MRRIGVATATYSLIAFSTWACSRDVSAPSEPLPLAQESAASTAQPEAEQVVARAFGLALSSPALRMGVLRAMRASPWVEHKLVLSDFLLTPTGRALLAASATAAGTTAEELAATVASLPPMDFYVPSRTARRAWRGTTDIVVAVALGADLSSVTGYSVSGYAVRLAGRNSLATTARQDPVLLLLQRAENKGRRAVRQPDGPGAVIQDEGDGEVAVQIVHRLGSGDSVVTDLAPGANGRWVPIGSTSSGAGASEPGTITTTSDGTEATCDPSTAIVPCDDGSGGGSGYEPPPPPPDTTFLTRLVTRGVCDLTDCGQGNEFEFRATEKTASGSYLSDRTLRLTGVPSSFTFDGRIANIFREVNGDGRTITVDVVETDFGGDDHFDPPPVFRYLSDRDRTWALGPFTLDGCPSGQDYCTKVEAKWYWN